MRILVTGSSGQIGSYIVKDLLAAEHNVFAVDIVRPGTSQCQFLQVDLTEAGEVYEAAARSKPDAVIHMGAWADAGKVADTRTYRDNVSATFNIFQVCADLGIRRIVSASSNQVYGFAGAPPVYVPVDEHHPLRPVNCYALSKAAGEQAASYFVKNFELTILSLRILGTRSPNMLAGEIEAMAEDPGSGLRLLWTRTDARDVATACRLAVEAREVASGAYNIAGPRVVLREKTARLLERYAGDATEIRVPLSGHRSPLDCSKAMKAFGYSPRFAWSEDDQHPEDGSNDLTI